MNLTEKIAYIKGLTEGLSLDESKPEVKVINAIIDLLDDIAYDVKDLEELYDELSEEVDEIDQDLADVEDELFDDDDEDYDDFDDFDDEEEPFPKMFSSKAKSIAPTAAKRLSSIFQTSSTMKKTAILIAIPAIIKITATTNNNHHQAPLV